MLPTWAGGICDDLDGVVPVGGFDQIEACQALLGFGERAICDGDLSVADAHGGGGANRLKGFRGEASARVSEGLVVSHALIVGHGADFLFLPVDET